MTEIPGEWALPQITRKLAEDGKSEYAEFTNTNFGTRMYRCGTCGLLQLYDWMVK